MYWRLTHLPELHHLSDSERTQLVRSSVGRGTTFWLIARSLAAGLLLSLLLTSVLQTIMMAVISTRAGNMAFYASPLLWPIVSAVVYQFFLTRVRGQLRIYLENLKRAGEDLPVCLTCGYFLQTDGVACPECGAKL